MTDLQHLEATEPRWLVLRTGRRVELGAPEIPFVPHYRVLSWPRDARAPTSSEIDEMFALAHAIARERGRELFGDPECFAVLYNGARARRMPWAHFHLIPARSPAERRFVLLCLVLKRVMRRVARWVPQRLRRGRLGA